MEHSQFFTTEQIGKTRHKTPEGYLLCTDVPIARIGVMLYADGEVPLEAGPNRIIRVHREPEEVFAPKTLASFAGKPVTDDHPSFAVSSGNWRDHSKGVVLNPRQGKLPLDPDYMYADLLIQDADAIKAVLEGKVEVSAGYDADYEQTGPGEGRQTNIVGNHVALVDKGRCGPRCSIGDKDMPARSNVRDRIMKAFRANDESALVDELDKISDLMGNTDPAHGSDNTIPGKDATHHLVINVHGSGGGKEPVMEDDAEDDAEEGDDDALGDFGDDDDYDEGGEYEDDDGDFDDDDDDDYEDDEGGGPDMSELLERIEALEHAVAILAGGGDGEKKEETAAPNEAEAGAEENEMNAGGGNEEKKEEKAAVGDRKTTKDSRRASVGDSTSMQSAFVDMQSRAELLVPGITFPTFDAAKPATTTHKQMCQFRRDVLVQAVKNRETRDLIAPMFQGKGMAFTSDAAYSCDDISHVFTGASELMRLKNNEKGTRAKTKLGAANATNFGTAVTPADINRRNSEHYKQ